MQGKEDDFKVLALGGGEVLSAQHLTAMHQQQCSEFGTHISSLKFESTLPVFQGQQHGGSNKIIMDT